MNYIVFEEKRIFEYYKIDIVWIRINGNYYVFRFFYFIYLIILFIELLYLIIIKIVFFMKKKDVY